MKNFIWDPNILISKFLRDDSRHLPLVFKTTFMDLVKRIEKIKISAYASYKLILRFLNLNIISMENFI